MKNLLLVPFLLAFHLSALGQSQATLYPPPNTAGSPFSVPELIRNYLVEKGYKIMDGGVSPVGFGRDLHGGEVKTAVLPLTVNLPRDVYQFEIFTFICNNGEGCLGPSGSWVRGENRYGHDLQFCQINQPHIIKNEDGTLTVRGFFINWSDCDQRRGKMFVAYNTKQMVFEQLKKELADN